MHIPGKPLMRPKNSMFRNTDARRVAYAAAVRRNAASHEPLLRIFADGLASQIEAGIGKTTTRNTNNQRKRRLARRQRWAAGDRFAFAA